MSEIDSLSYRQLQKKFMEVFPDKTHRPIKATAKACELKRVLKEKLSSPEEEDKNKEEEEVSAE